jgi:hypothetical protein
MDERFTCRNDHRWGLSVANASLLNPRWIVCPVCGAPPRPAQPLSAWRQSLLWMRRSPAAAGLVGSVLVLLAAVSILAVAQWKERTRSDPAPARHQENIHHTGMENAERTE